MAPTHLLVDVAGVLAAFSRTPRLEALGALAGLDVGEVDGRLYGSGFVDAADAGMDAGAVRAGIRERLDLAPDVAEAELERAWMAAFTVDERAQVVLDLLDRVRPPAVVALLSSNDALVAELLPAHLPQVAARADAAFFSGVTAISKPDPRAFTTALEALGASAGDALFLDDSLGHVQAARRAGVDAVHVTLEPASLEGLRLAFTERGLEARR